MTDTAAATNRDEQAANTPADALGSDTGSRPGLLTGSGRALRRSGPLLLLLSALVPPLMMLREVLRYPQMHFYDYWWVLLGITNPDGTLHPQGLLGFRNEHPFVLPSVLFWLSARFGGGLNQTLGLVVIGLGIGCVLLVWALLPRRLTPGWRAGLVAAASALLFNPHGLHNYVRSMSGASWILTLMLVLSALLLQQRQRPVSAIVIGLLASISYGTAFAVWPSLALVAWLRGQRRRWIVAPMAVGMVVVAAWLAVSLRYLAAGGAYEPSDDPARLILAGLSMLGMLWTGGEPTIALLAAVAGLAVLALHVRQSPEARREAAPWWGLVCFALGCAVMVSLSRGDYGSDAGLQSRYHSMSAALWIALLVIVVAWPYRPRPQLRAAVVISTVLATVALGAPMAQTVRDDALNQTLLAIGVRIGHPEPMTDRFPSPEKLIPRLRALGHYPFNDEFTLGCPDGIELGDRPVNPAWRTPADGALRGPRPGGGEVVLNVEYDQIMGSSRQLSGWAVSGTLRPQCVVVIDGGGTVVGGGVSTIPRKDVGVQISGSEERFGFKAFAPAGTGPLRVAFRFPDGWWIRPLTDTPQVVS